MHAACIVLFRLGIVNRKILWFCILITKPTFANEGIDEWNNLPTQYKRPQSYSFLQTISLRKPSLITSKNHIFIIFFKELFISIFMGKFHLFYIKLNYIDQNLA